MTKHRRDQGLGSVFRHKGCKRFTIQYHVDGRAVREATGLTSRFEAQKVLTARLNAVNRGEPVTIRPMRVSALYDYYQMKERKAQRLAYAAIRWKHVGPEFNNVLAARLTPPMILTYRVHREQQGAAVATINRELATLRHVLHVAHDDGLLAAVPAVHLEKEDNVRKGFVADTKLDQLRSAAGKELWLRAFVELATTYGWRRNEMLNLRCEQVDFAANVIRLEVGETKNGRGREVPMNTTVRTLLKECCHHKRPDGYVLTRPNGGPVRDVRCAWHNLCIECGLGHLQCRGCGAASTVAGRCEQCGVRRWKYVGLLVHDLRRTAVRNLRRAGVPEQTAMSITGHRTASTFRRYDIQDNADKVAALQLLERAHAHRAKALGQSSGKVVVKAGLPAAKLQ